MQDIFNYWFYMTVAPLYDFHASTKITVRNKKHKYLFKFHYEKTYVPQNLGGHD